MTNSASGELALAQLIGTNVKRLRLARDWSQRDLVTSLRNSDANWSRATVGLLESDGVRGERLSDLASLCNALQVSLWDLLAGQQTVTLRDGNIKSVHWVTSSLLGEHDSPATEPDLMQVGQHDPDLNDDWSRKVDLTANKFESFIDALAAHLNFDVKPSGSAAVLRDLMANVDVRMPRETVRAKRGHASRKILRAAELYSASPGIKSIREAVEVVWPNEIPDGRESDHDDD